MSLVAAHQATNVSLSPYTSKAQRRIGRPGNEMDLEPRLEPFFQTSTRIVALLAAPPLLCIAAPPFLCVGAAALPPVSPPPPSYSCLFRAAVTICAVAPPLLAATASRRRACPASAALPRTPCRSSSLLAESCRSIATARLPQFSWIYVISVYLRPQPY
jgi:hypothetical protein